MAFYLGYTFIDNEGNSVIKFIYGMKFETMKSKSKHSINQHHNYFYNQCRMKMLDINEKEFISITRYRITYMNYSEYLFSKLSKNKIFYIKPLSNYEYYPDMVICNTYVVSKKENWYSIARKILGSEDKAEYLAVYNKSSLNVNLIAGEVIIIPNIPSFKDIEEKPKMVINEDKNKIESNLLTSRACTMPICSIKRCKDSDIKNIISTLSLGDTVLIESDYSIIKKLYLFNGKELIFIGES